MPYKYAYQGEVKDTARAVARDVPISSKHAIMLANWIRGKSVTRVQRDLQQVIAKRTAVPFTRFTEGAGHKPGIGPGKYPVKAATEFLKLVNSVEANATDLGLGEDLRIASVTTHQAARAMRMGRKRGRQRKSSHIEIVVKASGQARKPKAEKQAEEKPEKKAASDTPKESEKASEKEPAKAKADKPKAEKKSDKKPAKKKSDKKTAPAKEAAEKKEPPKDTTSGKGKGTPAPKKEDKPDSKPSTKPKSEDTN